MTIYNFGAAWLLPEVAPPLNLPRLDAFALRLADPNALVFLTFFFFAILFLSF